MPRPKADSSFELMTLDMVLQDKARDQGTIGSGGLHASRFPFDSVPRGE